ncbi:mitochondrial proton/calcium exchanger protein-like isoform X2 [Brevipalpus obovatus]
MHYYHGFRLLSIEVRICTRSLWRVVRGHDLSRKDHQQVNRTTADLLRLFPFFAILILPFGGLALPICAKFYPYLLPSTFQSDHDKEIREKQQLQTKLEMVEILLQSLDYAFSKPKDASSSKDFRELTEFLDEVRKKDGKPDNRDIIRFMELLENKVALESFSRPQLVVLCKFLGMASLGPSSFLRYRLRRRLRGLKIDDQLIIKEGIDSLSEFELREACQERGMRGFHLSTEQLKNQLSQWLELSLNDKISPSLLLLSRVLYLPKDLPRTIQLNTIIRTKKTKSASGKETQDQKRS